VRYMTSISDVIVIGGGPCGSFTAYNLARQGVKVTVFEEHDEIGVPCHCPGHLNIKGLKQLGLCPLPAGTIENTFRGAVFHSAKGASFSVRFAKPITCTVNRVLFDKHIAKMAEDAGVGYYVNTRVDALVIDDGFVKGVAVKKNDGGETRCLAKIAVDAEGTSFRILRLAGLASPNRRMLVNGVHAELENVGDVEQDMVEVFLGNDYAPGFYAWIIPEGDGQAKVGLAARAGNPKELLEKLVHKHYVASKKLGEARILKAVFHPLTLGGLIPKAYSNGFLAVGDVASQVKPTTGGGIIFGMTCAGAAAKVIREALDGSDFSSEFLKAYQQRCDELLGFDMKVMLRVRRALNAMSDRKLDNMISLCNKLRLEQAFGNIEDIDFQGRSLVRLLRSPRMLTALFYFFFHYLSANP